MSEVVALDEEGIADKDKGMGSLNHSLVQGNLTVLLSYDERFTVLPELSLDVSQIDLNQFGLKIKDELKPDISAYLEPPKSVSVDILRVQQMPDLTIEILSPSQGISHLIAKITAYFALGIKSCWLVIPATKTITVYSQPTDRETYDTKDPEVVDKVMDIKIPVNKVFNKVD
jgi:Uma2 family endonuclease